MGKSRFTHFYYASIKDIVENHESIRYKCHQWTVVFLYLTSIVRFALIFNMFQEPSFEYWRYDHLAHFALHHSPVYRQFFPLLMLFCMASVIGMKIFYFTHVDTLTFQILHEIAVKNTENYWRNLRNPEEVSSIERQYSHEKLALLNQYHVCQWLPDLLLNQVAHLWAKLDLWFKLEPVDQGKFIREPLVLFPTLTLKSRSAAVLLLLVLDFGIFLLNTIICVYYYYPKLTASYPYWYHPVIMLDIVDCYVMVMAALHMVLIFTMITIFNTLTYVSHLRHVTRILVESQRRAVCKQVVSQFSFVWALNYFLREHFRVLYYNIYTDRDVWSKSLFVYTVVAIPINVYLIKLVMMKETNAVEAIIFATSNFIHLTTLFLPLMAMAYIPPAIHYPSKILFPVQLSLKLDHLHYKLKVGNLFARLTHGKKYGISGGPIGTITFRILFELAIVYVGVFIFILQHKTMFEKSNDSP